MIDWNTHQLNPQNKVQDDPLKKEVIAPLRAYFSDKLDSSGTYVLTVRSTTSANVHAFVAGILTASSFHQTLGFHTLFPLKSADPSSSLSK